LVGKLILGIKHNLLDLYGDESTVVDFYELIVKDILSGIVETGYILSGTFYSKVYTDKSEIESLYPDSKIVEKS
jgi:hypothetical protein